MSTTGILTSKSIGLMKALIWGAALCLIAPGAVSAATIDWTGGTSTLWSLGANWSGSSTPARRISPASI